MSKRWRRQTVSFPPRYGFNRRTSFIASADAPLMRVIPLDDRFHETGRHGTGDLFMDSPFGFGRARNGIMAGWRQVIELAMTDEEIGRLAVIARSRSEPASRVERAQM